jgi:hypothetical protein
VIVPARSLFADWRRWRESPVEFSVDPRNIADRQTQSRDGAAVPNDDSLLVWVLDQILGMLKRSARTAEEEEAVRELRTLALLPKPDKTKLESLIHRLETMGSMNPESMRTHRTLKRAGVKSGDRDRKARDAEMISRIQSLLKKTGPKKTTGKKIAARKPTGKMRVAAKKTAVRVGGKKTAAVKRGPATKARA